MKKILLLIVVCTSFSMNAQFWTEKSTGFSTATRGIGSISIPNATTIWASATDGTGTATNVKEITRSTDGGNTWTATVLNLGIGTPQLAIGSVSAVSATTAWISLTPGTTSTGGIWKTTDSGVTYTKQTTAAYSPNSFTNWVHFFDANNGVTQGDPESGYFELYTTSNGGTNWTRVPTANIPLPLNTNEYGYTDNFFVSGNTIWFGTSLGRLYKSTNMGLNWTVAQTPLTDFGSTASSGALAFSSTTTGLLISSAGLIYKTIDGGATFTSFTSAGYFSGNLAYVPGTTGTFVSTGATGSSYTLDYGLTWNVIDAIQHTKVEFFNTTVGVTGGFSTNSTTGGVSKYTGTVLKTSTFEAGNLSVYPNPVNDIITITDKGNTSFNSISITDINGRTIKAVETGNVSEFQMNLSDLNAGVYFLNISSESGKAVKKFIKN